MANPAFLQALRMRQANAPKRRPQRLRRPPKWLLPLGIERDYMLDLLAIVARAENELEQRLIAALPSLVQEAASMRPDRLDDFIGHLASILQATRTALELDFPDMAIVAQRVAQRVSAFNREQERRILQSVLSVDVFRAEPWLADQLGLFAAENARLIKSLPEDMLSQVEGIVQRGLASGMRPEELAAGVRERFGVARGRARLIARDQVSKLNANLTELRQRDLGVARYVWRTSRDGRVRESHREKNGQVFEWNSPPVDTGHPGQDFQCRCYAEPVFSDLMQEAGANV